MSVQEPALPAPAAPRVNRHSRRAAPPPDRIVIGDEELLRDEIFCDEFLAGCTRKTSKRYEAEGLPFIWVAGVKYRPKREGGAWVLARIQRKTPKARRTKHPK